MQITLNVFARWVARTVRDPLVCAVVATLFAYAVAYN